MNFTVWCSSFGVGSGHGLCGSLHVCMRGYTTHFSAVEFSCWQLLLIVLSTRTYMCTRMVASEWPLDSFLFLFWQHEDVLSSYFSGLFFSGLKRALESRLYLQIVGVRTLTCLAERWCFLVWELWTGWVVVGRCWAERVVCVSVGVEAQQWRWRSVKNHLCWNVATTLWKVDSSNCKVMCF